MEGLLGSSKPLTSLQILPFNAGSPTKFHRLETNEDS
jgi:hypothetical protein